MNSFIIPGKSSSQRMQYLIAVAACLVLTGCAVGPDYHRPAALPSDPLPAHFGDPGVTNEVSWKVAEPSAHLPRGKWWETFQDPELNRLELLATTNNQQLAVAAANLDQARAASKASRAGFFPEIDATPSFTRQRTSANASPTSASAGRSITFNQFRFGGDAVWEVDLWGRIRRQFEGAKARLGATADDLEAAKLSIQAEVAIDYFTVRSLEEQSSLLHRTADAFQQALELTRHRHESGIATDLDVAQAETQLETARAQIPAVELQRAQTRHALAALCGQAAGPFALGAGTATEQPHDVWIPAVVPSDWLERRPDIAGAERRMAAANADVGVAKAAFYPRIILSGSAGFESVTASKLFEWPSTLWAIGPSIQWPIFTGGLNRAQLASTRAAYRGAVASYRQTVVTAFQDVEDQLAAEALLADQLQREQSALGAARRALEISNNRYKAGVEQYLDVITAQTAVLTHEQAVVQLKAQRLVTSVTLIKATGAGGQASELSKDLTADANSGKRP